MLRKRCVDKGTLPELPEHGVLSEKSCTAFNWVEGGGGIQVLTNTISVFMYTVRTFPKDFFVVVEMELIKL